jgi:deoxyribodipyrimidine photolyase
MSACNQQIHVSMLALRPDAAVHLQPASKHARASPLLEWKHGSMAAWQHGSMAAWQHGSMAAWRHGSMAAWRHGSMAAWQHGSTPVVLVDARMHAPGLEGLLQVAALLLLLCVAGAC